MRWTGGSGNIRRDCLKSRLKFIGELMLLEIEVPVPRQRCAPAIPALEAETASVGLA